MSRVGILSPADGSNPQLALGVDESADVVGKQLAVRLVLHGHVGAAPQAVAQLPLDRGEYGLDLAALMVVGQELLAVQAEVYWFSVNWKFAFSPLARDG